MTKQIKDMDLLLAGQLADMLGAVGDIGVSGPTMTVPMRDIDHSIVFFEFDIRGLAERVANSASDAIAAMGNERGGQRAALALVVNEILEEHDDEWDVSEAVEVVYEAGGDYEPIVIDMDNPPWA